MSSGVDVDQQVRDVYQKFKMQKKHRFFSVRIIDNALRVEEEKLKVDDEDSQQVAHGDSGSAAEDPCLKGLFSLLSDGKARFIFLDYPVINKACASLTDQLFVIQYIPDKCNVKERMLYASSALPIKRLCEDSCKIFQLNDLDELSGKELQDIYCKK